MFKDEYLIAVWKSELSIDKGPFLRFCRMSITNASNLLITQKLKMQWSKVFGFFWSLSIDPTWHKQFVLVPILIKSENNKTFSKVSITNEIFALIWFPKFKIPDSSVGVWKVSIWNDGNNNIRSQTRIRGIQPFQVSVSYQLQGLTHKSEYL